MARPAKYPSEFRREAVGLLAIRAARSRKLLDLLVSRKRPCGIG